MADSKVTALTALTALTGDETFYVVEDDDGTPVSRQITVEDLAIGLAPFMVGKIGGPPKTVVKGSNESVTSSASLQNDDELILPLGTNETWLFELVLYYHAPTAGDIQWDFTVPASAAVYAGLIALAPGAASQTADFKTRAAGSGAASGSVGGGGAGTEIVAIVKGRVTTGATSGNLQFRWAQDSSNGTATVVLAQSHIIAHRIA